MDALQCRLARAAGLPRWLIMGAQGLRVDRSEMQAWASRVREMQKRHERRMWGAEAPRRKRKKRLAKKLRKRGGYLRCRSAGARLLSPMALWEVGQ